ncbi:MAG: hypothetical protein U0807_11105 [Candidatus Binatia bacterium]
MKLGEVALVRFPFADIATAKKRPALVLARTIRSPRNRHPSLLRLAKVATVDAHLIDETIGRLSAHDLRAARQAIHRVYAFWLA